MGNSTKITNLPYLENYHEYFSYFGYEDTMLLVRIKRSIHDCQNCLNIEEKLKEQGSKIFIWEVENSLNVFEEVEIRLRKIAKQWTYYHFIIPHLVELQSPFRFKHDQEKEKSRITNLPILYDGREKPKFD